jgi:shikimate kinase
VGVLRSKDGSTIAFGRSGKGPAVIAVNRRMESRKEPI